MANTDHDGTTAVETAAEGARIGLCFAACEQIASSWLTRLSNDGLSYVPQSWISFGVMSCASAAVGALFAVVFGPLARRCAVWTGRTALRETNAFVTLAFLALVMAWNGLQFETHRVEARDGLYLALATSVVALAAWGVPAWRSWLSAIAHPWCVFALLALLPWLTTDVMRDAGWRDKRLATIVFTAGVWALACAARKNLASKNGMSWRASLSTSALALAGSWLGTDVIDRELELDARSNAPPVILISLDTVRAANMSLYGYERDTTPRLREFAAQATRFERSYAAANYTLPSHASMLTGLYAREHGAYPDRDASLPPPLAREQQTVVETLARHGWNTIGVVANHGYLGPTFGLHQGFAHYDARPRRLGFSRAGAASLRRALHEILYTVLPPVEFDLTYRRAEEINSAIAERLDRHERDFAGAPFFLFANYMDAHVPYSPLEPYASRFAPGVEPVRKTRFYGWRARVYAGEMRLADEERQRLIDLYDASIAYLDAQIGELFDELRRRGLYDRALILVTSDHGESFGSRAVLEHGMSVDESEIRVPLLVKLPRQSAPVVVDTLASGVDIAPTILAHVGLPLPNPCAGRDLFAQHSDSDRVVYAEHFPHHWHQRVAPERALHETAAMWHAFKVVRRDDGQVEFGVVDAVAKPIEALDRWPADAPDLPHVLEEWTVRPRSSLRPSSGDAEALKALGYTD